MTPLDLIKEGFAQKDWTLISDAYRMLTGTKLSDGTSDVEATEPKVKRRGRPSKKVSVANVVSTPSRSKRTTKASKATPEEFYANRRGKTTLDLVDERPNWFETAQYGNKDRTDEIFKKKVYKAKRALPKPPAIEKKKFVCRKCSHVDMLYPSQVVVGNFSSKGYYCNNCCGSR